MKKNIFLILMVISLQNSCTTGRSLIDKKYSHIEKIDIGSSQKTVEKILGMRDKTLILHDGHHIDYYPYSKKLEKNFAKTFLYSALSISSYGAWEIFGGAMEDKARKEQIIGILYDKRGIVVDFPQHDPLDPLNLDLNEEKDIDEQDD